MTMEKEKISQVNFKMPEKDKKEVTAIFKYYGLDLSTGIKRNCQIVCVNRSFS